MLATQKQAIWLEATVSADRQCVAKCCAHLIVFVGVLDVLGYEANSLQRREHIWRQLARQRVVGVRHCNMMPVPHQQLYHGISLNYKLTVIIITVFYTVQVF
jgi:hypothetical protein